MSFTRIKTITNRSPGFLKVAYRLDHLIDLQNDQRFIKPGEVFITYDDGAWDLWRQSDPPRYIGRYESLNKAVFYGRMRRRQ